MCKEFYLASSMIYFFGAGLIYFFAADRKVKFFSEDLGNLIEQDHWHLKINIAKQAMLTAHKSVLLGRFDYVRLFFYRKVV